MVVPQLHHQLLLQLIVTFIPAEAAKQAFGGTCLLELFVQIPCCPAPALLVAQRIIGIDDAARDRG